MEICSKNGAQTIGYADGEPSCLSVQLSAAQASLLVQCTFTLKSAPGHLKEKK